MSAHDDILAITHLIANARDWRDLGQRSRCERRAPTTLPICAR